jgi:predicted nucleic acid-binding protein
VIVVADTTPLHYLILLQHADILRELYGRVIVPEAVVHELRAAGAPEAVKQWMARPPLWLEVKARGRASRPCTDGPRRR